MIERRFFIPETAKDIFEIEFSSRFFLIGDFDNGKIYHDTLSEDHDLYYVEHGLMSNEETEKYLEIISCDENSDHDEDSSKSTDFDMKVMRTDFAIKILKKEPEPFVKNLECQKKNMIMQFAAPWNMNQINHTTHPAGLRREKEGKICWMEFGKMDLLQYFR